MIEQVTVTGEQVLEGTWEEISAKAMAFQGHRVRLTVLPSSQESDSGSGEPRSLSDMLGDFVGSIRGGGRAWSEETSSLYTDGLEEKRKRGSI